MQQSAEPVASSRSRSPGLAMEMGRHSKDPRGSQYLPIVHKRASESGYRDPVKAQVHAILLSMIEILREFIYQNYRK